jgi:nicotinamide-nucleotide amidase
MKAEILCVGTELLLGDIINTNASYIARELAALGIEVYHQAVVGDNPGRLQESLGEALDRSDLVVLTGGLGPTYDDLTKETVASFFNREMKLHEESLMRITCFFQRIDRPMTENNRKQAMMPEGAVIFRNNYGTAPGLAVEGPYHGGDKIVILLPGPPRRWNRCSVRRLNPIWPVSRTRYWSSHGIHIFGMGESQVEQTLKEIMVRSSNPTVAPYAKDGEVLLRVTAKGRDEHEAEALLQPMIDQIRSILGDVIYGVDIGSLQAAAVKELSERGLTAPPPRVVPVGSPPSGSPKFPVPRVSFTAASVVIPMRSNASFWAFRKRPAAVRRRFSPDRPRDGLRHPEDLGRIDWRINHRNCRAGRR